jgi:hypothetical protein
MNTYNTGKVQIGCAYTAPQRPYHDKDALRLQDALLNTRQPSAAEIFFVRLVRRFWAWC